MNSQRPLRSADPFGTMPPQTPGVRIRMTRDHEVIRDWGAAHQAVPATGEATASGAASVVVRDGGAGIRFNFPGFGRFRPISWDEWFAHFDQHRLLFVFDERNDDAVSTRAHEISVSRGGEAGHDRDDWFQAERDIQQHAGGGSPSVRYRFVQEGADGLPAW